MSVQIKYTTKLRTGNERFKRLNWFRERIPSSEYLITVDECKDVDGWEPDDDVETTVTVWSDDAELVATEFWFKFP
jgi:hypothetical protein